MPPRTPIRVVIPALLSRDRRGIGGTAGFVRTLESQLRKRHLPVTILGYGPRANDDEQFQSVTGRPRGRDLSWALWRRRKSWRFPPDTLFHLQRPDHALGYLKGPWPLVITFHGRHLRSIALRGGPLAALLYHYVERKVCRRAAALIFVSRSDMQAVLKGGPHLAEKAHHIPIGIDRNRFTVGEQAAARRRLGLPQAPPAIAYVGRLEKEKNVPALIRAIEMVPGAELWIAGTGRDERSCRGIAGPRVRFLGALDPDGVPPLLQGCDALALASRYEGLPTVVLEAWACGRPVIAPPVGDLPELLAGGGGILTRDNHPDRLAGAIRTLIANLPASRAPREASEAGLRDRTKPYDWDVTADRICQVYELALDRRRRRLAGEGREVN